VEILLAVHSAMNVQTNGAASDATVELRLRLFHRLAIPEPFRNFDRATDCDCDLVFGTPGRPIALSESSLHSSSVSVDTGEGLASSSSRRAAAATPRAWHRVYQRGFIDILVLVFYPSLLPGEPRQRTWMRRPCPARNSYFVPCSLSICAAAGC